MGEPMSDAEFRTFAQPSPNVEDMTPDQLAGVIDRMVPIPTTPEQQAELAAMLPPTGQPDAALNVVRSLRLPEELNRRLEEAAEAENIPTSVYIRRAIESALAGRVRSNLVSLDDVYRAISALPKAVA